MGIIFLELYRIVYSLSYFLIGFFTSFNAKLKKGIRMREPKNGIPPWLNFRNLQSPILIHCASGEFEYAKPLIREIKKKNPNQSIVVTYFSPSYESQIKNTKDIDFSCPLPWDLPAIQKDFLTKLKPKMILISRTDLWPEFLYQAKQQKIPVSIFSSVLSAKSSKITNPLIRLYQKWLYSFIHHIYAVSENDKANLSHLIDPKRISVLGDTRFDQSLFRISNPNHLKTSLIKDKNMMNSVFIAGSTWQEDEKEIIPVFPELIKNNIQIIIAPHEPSEPHIEKLKSQIKNLNLTPLLYSEATTWKANQVLIIDQVGILADLYSWADWAFVGGSFKKQVHSVMEPLAQGCKTFFGPYYSNNREAISFQHINAYATSVASGAQMLHLMLKNRNLETSNTFKTDLKQTVRAKAGASEKLATILTRH